MTTQKIPVELFRQHIDNEAAEHRQLRQTTLVASSANPSIYPVQFLRFIFLYSSIPIIFFFTPYFSLSSSRPYAPDSILFFTSSQQWHVPKKANLSKTTSDP